MSLYKKLIEKCFETFNSPQRLAAMYKKDRYEDWMIDSYFKEICASTVLSEAFMSKYKELDPIENLDPEEKTNMKKYVHELFPGRDVVFKLRAVKVIYTFGTLLNE